MLSSLKNIFKIPDLRNKILFTLMMVAVYRFGTTIRVPGIDHQAIKQLQDAASTQGAIGFLNLFSGGAFESFSIFALGIMPYITASIIMQILGVVIPKLEQLQQQGAVGTTQDHPVHPLRHDRPGDIAGDGTGVRVRHGAWRGLPVGQRTQRADPA